MGTAAPTLASVTDSRGLKAFLTAQREGFLERLRTGEDGVALGRQHARLLDAVLDRLVALASSSNGGVAPVIRGLAADRWVLAAAGSYGRGAVALRSDADVRLLVASEGDRDAAAAFAESLFYPLWDAGVSLGHQVVTVGETLSLAQTDLATATTLLDLRGLAGHGPMLQELLRRAFGGLFEEGELGTFVDRLEEEVRGRHARFGGSVYLLEPDVKAGAGGLRDLDVARWAARARYHVGDGPEGAHGAFAELVRLGVLVAREAQEIVAAEEFLWRVRNHLHARGGRRSDRLTFDEQEGVAAELDYAPLSTSAPGSVIPPGGTGAVSQAQRATGAERFMQDYYLHARVVTGARERMLERARPPRRRGRPVEVDLGRGVRAFDGQVSLEGEAALHDDPALAFRVYSTCVHRDAPLLPFAREAIARAAADPAWCAALRTSREAADLFVELVCTVAETKTRRGSMVAELHDVGLLLAMIPEFRPVTGRVQHDVYHVYTVDVHSVAAVDFLRALARGEQGQEHPLACRLAVEIARPRVVFLATLLHDVGKGYPDATGSRKNHSKSGAELCDVILPRLGFAADEVEDTRALVLQHLAMYHTATRRDLDDPDTIEEFCRTVVRGREELRDLYLLTVVDIATTSPTALTTWKARMLDELYFAADRHFIGSGSGPVDDERAGRVVASAEAAWSEVHGPLATFRAFVASMPDRYVAANPPESIVAHGQVALGRGQAPIVAGLVASRHAEVAELCVVGEDRPGLLANIAAALTAGKLEVLGAQVYSRSMAGRGAGSDPRAAPLEAVDVFWVRDRGDGPEAVARALPRLQRDLLDIVSGRVDPRELLRSRTGSSPWRERPSPPVAPDVVVDDRASPRHTVIEVVAKDRPGLLHTLARTLHEQGLQIALSKINTEGTKVADVFYVSELDGTKVAPGERTRAVRDALFAAVTADPG